MTDEPAPTPANDPRKWRLPEVAELHGVELPKVLRRLRRHTASGREKAANDPATRSYLQAGLRLLSAAVTAPVDDSASGPADPASHPFMSWMSRRKVVAEMQNETDPVLPRIGSDNGLRDRWEPHSDFVSDLLSVAVVANQWTRAVSKGAHEHLVSIMQFPPSAVAHEIAYQDLVQLTESDGFRVQILAAAMARNDQELGSSFQSLYEDIAKTWVPIYEAVLEKWRRQLRTGFTMDMFSALLAGMAEGLALRVIETSEERPLLDRSAQVSLLGQGALAVILSATVEIGSEDHRTLEQFADEALTPK